MHYFTDSLEQSDHDQLEVNNVAYVAIDRQWIYNTSLGNTQTGWVPVVFVHLVSKRG